MKPLYWAILLALPFASAMAAPEKAGTWRWSLPSEVAPPKIPADNPMSAAKVALGRRLFYDADLSSDGTLSCASCHSQRHGFSDSTATRAGVHGNAGRRNAPGLANVAWLPRLTWADPALTTLEAQALVPIFGVDPVEMGMKGLDAEIRERLSGDACYRAMFQSAFPERAGVIDRETVAAAIGAFERTLISLDSPFDRYRRGRTDAISPAARRGAAFFAGTGGCANCHSGRDLTDGEYHPFPALPSATDAGLFEKTGRKEDTGHFRTPSLRNVAVGGPWLHDGSATTLDDALNRHATPVPVAQKADLLAFLDSLTDQHFLEDKRFAYPDRACGRRL